MTTIPLTAETLLVRLLGEQDAIYWPWRDPRAKSWAHAWEARRLYLDCGMPWRGNGADATETKALHLALNELVDAGLVRRFRAKGLGVRANAVRLTIEGDVLAGRLASFDREGDAIQFAVDLHAAALARHGKADAWTAEIALSKDGAGWGDGNREALLDVVDRMMPAAVRGLVESNCTARAHVGYRLTAAGLAAVESAAPRAEFNEAFSDHAIGIYYDARLAAIQQMKSKQDDINEIGEIPLSCGIYF